LNRPHWVPASEQAARTGDWEEAMNGFRRAGGAVLAAAMVFCGCGRNVPPPQTNPQEQAEYQIGRQDVLDVSVWHDADISRVVPVRPDGKISLPLLGDVLAEGKTARGLASEIAERLKPFVDAPRVAVIVKEVNAPRFNVIGEVQKPGTFPLRGDVTVLEALSQAGGFNPFADQGGIVIVRHQGQKTARYSVSYSDLVSGDEKAVYLVAGDTVYVP
jgi:polysaccharide biosynthesis/export protein